MTKKRNIAAEKKKKKLISLLGTLVILALYILFEFADGDQPTVEDRQEVRLVRVVDGDTLIVNYQGQDTRVRLIGINAPESVHEDASKNTQEGRDASAFLKEYLDGTSKLWLEFDTERTDQYNRMLAYVWMNPEGTDVGEDMLNGIIVKKGFAQAKSYEPNVRYHKELKDVEVGR